MRFGVGRLELYFVFSFVLFIEGLDDRAFVAGSCLAGFATLMPNLITVAPSASFVALVFPPHPASIPTIIVAAAVADNTVINAFFS